MDNSVYITVHNAGRIVKKIEPGKLANLQGEIYERVLPLFSGTEKNRLLGIQELLKNPALFIDRYYDPAKVAEDSGRFIRPDMNPAYHAKRDCLRLHSDYKNYRIPNAVYSKGPEGITQFRKWFREHEKMIDENKESFYREMAKTFNLPNTGVEEVFAPNTGCELLINLSLPELRIKIEKLLDDADEYCQSSPRHMRILCEFMTKTWLAYTTEPIKFNRSGCPDSVIKPLLIHFSRNFKVPVQRLLVEYYRVKFNPDMTFQGKLLDRLGFVSCKTCSVESSE